MISTLPRSWPLREEKPGVAQIRNQDVTVEGLGQTGIAALRLLAGELEGGALLTIEADRTRVR
jgi:predicted nuclease of predicted toxin-antitoxin system